MPNRQLTHRPGAAWWLPLAAALLTAAAFAPAIHCGFTNWDDPDYVLNNPLLRDLSPSGIKAIATAFVQGNYHPLTILSLALDYHIWKVNPFGYHLTNVILHVLATLAVFRLIFVLTGSGTVSLIASLFFGVHPVHVESVAWVSARKDVLYALFYFAACVSYVLWIRKGRWVEYSCALALFALSLLSKGMAVPLPLSLVVIDFYLRRPMNRRTILLEKAPFFALALALGVIAIVAQHRMGATQEFATYPFWERALVACHAIVAYLIRAVAPLRLSAFYPYPITRAGAIPFEYYLAPVAIALLGWAIAASLRVGRAFAFCGAFFLVNVALVLQLYPIGSAAMADRYTYVPYVGVGMALALGYRDLRDGAVARSAGRAVALLVLVIFFAGLTLATRERLKVWRDNIALWTDVLNQYRDLPLAYAQRAWSYHERGDSARAMTDVGRAISLEPENAYARTIRGTIYYAEGDYPRALADLDVALKFRPGSASARNNRGITLLAMGRTDSAIEDFNRAIGLKPDYTEAYLNRGLAFGVKREFVRVVADLDRAIALDTGNSQAYVWRGVAKVELGDLRGGIEDYNEALRLSPSFGQARLARSKAYESLGRYDEALRDALKAQELGYRIGVADIERMRAGAAKTAPAR